MPDVFVSASAAFFVSFITIMFVYAVRRKDETR
jgi:hypothetical protein